MKTEVRVLDATAGNRSIWRIKRDSRILFIDIEPELEIPPDQILDCTNTGFQDKRFHTIIFDPPHDFNMKPNTGYATCPNRKYLKKNWPNKIPMYYGADKYQSRTAFMAFIHKAGKEFERILQDDGCLWLKWGERRAKVNAILPLLEGFQEMIRLPLRLHGKGSHGAYWLLMMKKSEELILETTIDQHMKTCPKCGTIYSDLIPNCPKCQPGETIEI